VPTHYTAASYLLNVESGETSPLPAGLEEGFSLSGTYVFGYVPSPDGTRVIAVNECAWPRVGCAGSGRIAVGNIDGSHVRTITPPDGAKAGWAGWSPDGNRIVYEATVDITSSRQLVIEDVTTGAQNQVTHLEPFDGPWLLSPTFAPDGQSVLFMLPDSDSDRCCASDVWSVPVTGGEPTLVITDAAFPAPLSDGKTVVYLSGGGIWAARVDDPGSARLVTFPYGVLGLWASADGARLAYGRAYGRPGGLPPSDPGGVNVVDLGTGRTDYVVDRGGASWLDNDTLIVTEVRTN
jgi:Tol biopolymer transport system component